MNGWLNNSQLFAGLKSVVVNEHFVVCDKTGSGLVVQSIQTYSRPILAVCVQRV
jgi:hypothetical protein